MAEPFNIFTCATEIEAPRPAPAEPAPVVPPVGDPYELEAEASVEPPERRVSSERESVQALGIARGLVLGALGIVAIVLGAALFGAGGERAFTGEARNRAQPRPEARTEHELRASLASLRSDQTRLWSAWRRLERRLSRTTRQARGGRSEPSHTGDAAMPQAGATPEPPVVGPTLTRTQPPSQVPSSQIEFGFER